MIEEIGQFGASVLAYMLFVGLLVAAGWLTDRASHHLSRRFSDEFGEMRKVGCLFQAVIFSTFLFLFWLLFAPSIVALQRHACKGADDFSACMQRDQSDDYDRP